MKLSDYFLSKPTISPTGSEKIPVISGGDISLVNVSSLSGGGGGGGGRRIVNLSDSIVIHVNPAGSDANDGSENYPFKTIQAAIDHVALNYEYVGLLDNSALQPIDTPWGVIAASPDAPPLSIQLAEGVYDEAILLRNIPGGRTFIRGADKNHPEKVVIAPRDTPNACAAVSCINYALWSLWNVTISDRNRTKNMNFIQSSLYASVDFWGLHFETNYGWNNLLSAAGFGSINAWWWQTVVVRGTKCGSLVNAYGNARVSFSIPTLIFADPIAFEGPTAVSYNMSNVEFSPSTIIGGEMITGQRYQVVEKSLLLTYGGGESFIPGDVAGECDESSTYM